MKNVYLRNFVATATLVFMCFLLVAVSFVGIGRGYIINDYRERMDNNASEVARTASAIADGDSLTSWSLSMTLSSISRTTGNQVFITDETGKIVSCSDRAPMCEHLGHQIPADVMQTLETTGEYDQMSTLGGLYEKNRYAVARPIKTAADGNDIIGYVFITNVVDNILKTWSSLTGITAIVTIGVFAAAMIVSLMYSKHMAKPLDEMAAASRRFARGDFSVRVRQREDPTDEMGALIDSFNKMADSLENAEARRSEFIANISHELRTPMTTISGFAEGLLDGTIPPEDEKKYLRAISDETKRLSRLVRDMLDASQLRNRAADPTKRIDFDLTELTLQTLLSFESRATKKNLDVDPQLPDNHIMVHADKDAITQVIYNLLDNAVKFASPGSCITVRIYKDNGKAYVSVRDYGETIPPDDLPFIFDRFHKSDRSRSLDKDGVGLGLYLVKSIINSHDEDIAVTSRDGMTEFVFTLTLAKNEPGEKKTNLF